MTDLKPCPFCGEDDLLEATTKSDPGTCKCSYVECDNCGARGPKEYGNCSDDEMETLASRRWNERIEVS